MANALISFEVSGPAAMFTRPDAGAAPVSYPVPTYSAVKGMCEAVLRQPHVYIKPRTVEICRPVRFERYVTNYGGPLRDSDQIRERNNYQLSATILVDVHYRVFAEVKEKRRSGIRRADYAKEFCREFDRRLVCGQTFYTPCLGWKEFVPSYFGPLRDGVQPDVSVSGEVPSLLRSVWEQHRVNTTFDRNVRYASGVLHYP